MRFTPSPRAAGVAGWLVVAALLVLASGGAAARPDGWLLGVAGVPLLAVSGVAVALVAWRAGIAAGAWATGLAFLPLLLLAGVPVPGLRALSGPPLTALALAAAAAALARGRRLPPRWLLLPAAFAVYAAVATRVQSQVGPEGDEPHYLMVADSLLRDHDVSLERDYAEGRYRVFHPGDLAPHYRVRGRHGQIFSLHAVGLSVLILPAYALGGYPAASFFMALLAALLAREVRETALAWRFGEAAAEAAGWAVALSPPLIHYAGLIFTEVPAALAVAMALRRGRDLSAARTADVVLLGAALAVLPWLNVRYAVLAGLLLLFALTGRPSRRVVAVVLAFVAAAAVGLAVYHEALYGFWDPRRVYGRRPELSLATVPEGVPGLLLDQEFGLLVYAPVFALAFPGCALLFGRSRRGALAAGALIVATLLLAGSWPMWRGGWNPPARFLVPVLPALALGLAASFQRGITSASALLLGWSVWLGLAGGFEPRLVHRDRDGTAPLFRVLSGAEEWTRLLPGYVLPEENPDRHRLALLWAAALGIAAASSLRPGTRPRGAVLAGLGLLVATGTASLLSTHRTAGRDAVRLVGRVALSVPGWRLLRSAGASWASSDLAWGPLYEPHRHPEGAAVGERLLLPVGHYRLDVDGDEVAPEMPPPSLVIRPDGPVPSRSVPMETLDGARVGGFDVRAGEGPVTLLLEGGGPFVVRRIRLQASTFAADSGLSR
ncbi:MAG TPA: hypothetical protein VGN09_09020 [Vicinamibacteria bacterium]